MIRAYVRVSTGEQADSGLGLEAQRAAIVCRCASKEWEIDRWYEDAGHSGKNLKRPGIDELLADIGRGDTLVIAKLCRVSRSLHDFSGLLERAGREGWALVCLDPDLDLTSPNGRLVANVLAAVMQWEREIIGQRTREALAAKRARGERLGAAPLISPDVAARILEMRAQGLPLREVCERLESDGIPTPNGGARWRPSSLQGLLAR